MKDLLIITGVRPQYIKAKALYEELVNSKIDKRKIHIIDLGQHYSNSLSRNIKNELGLKIDFQIKHKQNSSQIQIIGKSLLKIEEYINLKKIEDKLIIVFGDANPALIGAIYALKSQSQLIHIEAGARRDKREQEHWNSKIVDDIASFKFCVTSRAKQFLEEEGNGDNTIVTGDICYNLLKFVNENHLKDLEIDNSVLVTLHRPFNINIEGIKKMVAALGLLDKKIFWILHPRTEKILHNLKLPNNITLTSPMTHIELLKKIKQADFVITDSGGVARESHFLKKVVFMRRDVGGWKELQEIGVLHFFSFDDLMEKLKSFRETKENYPISSPFFVEGGMEKVIFAINCLMK